MHPQISFRARGQTVGGECGLAGRAGMTARPGRDERAACPRRRCVRHCRRSGPAARTRRRPGRRRILVSTAGPSSVSALPGSAKVRGQHVEGVSSWLTRARRAEAQGPEPDGRAGVPRCWRSRAQPAHPRSGPHSSSSYTCPERLSARSAGPRHDEGPAPRTGLMTVRPPGSLKPDSRKASGRAVEAGALRTVLLAGETTASLIGQAAARYAVPPLLQGRHRLRRTAGGSSCSPPGWAWPSTAPCTADQSCVRHQRNRSPEAITGKGSVSTTLC